VETQVNINRESNFGELRYERWRHKVNRRFGC
jgi:hypothetical protein